MNWVEIMYHAENIIAKILAGFTIIRWMRKIFGWGETE